jgi:hypothetical protein
MREGADNGRASWLDVFLGLSGKASGESSGPRPIVVPHRGRRSDLIVPIVLGPPVVSREVASDSDETAPESDPSVLVVQGPALTFRDVASDSDETAPELHPSVPVEQVTAFFRDSFENFALFLAERIADAHGLGPVVRTMKWVCGACKWALAAERGGGVDVDAPLPLVPGDVLDVTVHLARDADTLPVTLSIAPNGESGVGAVAFGPLEIDPAPRHRDAHEDQVKLFQVSDRSVAMVPLRVSQALADRIPQPGPTDLNAPRVAAVAREMAEQKLLPDLLQGREAFADADVDLVLGYDSAMGLAVWAGLSVGSPRSGLVVVTPAGDELLIEVVPGVADLVIRYHPATGLGLWLRFRDAKAVLIPVMMSVMR